MEQGKLTILAIDDDQDTLDMIRVILESNGYDMVEATSAKNGLKVYKEKHPDFIIVDLMMEEMDAGLNFMKEIMQMGNEAPVYMLTSVGDNMSQMVDYSELGLSGVLQKPIEKENILKILQSRFESK